MAFGKNDKTPVTPFSKPAILGDSRTLTTGSSSSGSTTAINSSNDSSAVTNKIDVLLGKGSKISGNLQFSGTVVVEGCIEGEIRSDGQIILGADSQINAQIFATEIIVRGTVFGDITSTKKLRLEKPAKIKGNIRCNLLSIEEGVCLDGRIESNVVSDKSDGKVSEIKIGKVA